MNHLDELLIPGLQGIANVAAHPATPALRARLTNTARNSGTMVVAGPRGSGKRIAIAASLDGFQQPHRFVTMPPAPSENRLMAELREAILGDREEYELRDMQDDLIATLNQDRSILIINQAQELTTKAASALQYLHSRPDTRWALVLVGSDTLERASTTSARLRGDILTTMEIHPLKGEELLRALRAMHACFGISDPKLLRLIDHEYCFGLLRRWAVFLQHALDLENATDPESKPPEITLDLARAATSLMPPWPRPKT